MRKIILFELNEVPYSVVDHYVKNHPNSFLAKVLPRMTQVETVTEDTGELSPWITWPTLHRGVSNVAHHIKDFGEDLTKVDAQYPPIWKILSDKGLRPGVFSSMHTYPLPANYADYAYFIPDPFAGDSASYPDSLEPFQRFNLAMSRKSGRNVDTGIDIKAASALAISLPSLGIRVQTLMDVASQLLDEQKEKWKKNRRRTFQSVLAFDIFMKLLKKKQPTFTTFFSNHVASTMHRYWAATFPDHYEKYNLSDEWRTRFSGEIDYSMGKFDGFLERLVAFADANPDYKLVVASSMGQEATKAEQLSTELYGKDFAKFVGYLGLNEGEWEMKNAMHPQYNLQVKLEGKADTFETKLKQVVVNGLPLIYRRKENGFFSINFGHRNMANEWIEVAGQQVSFSEVGLMNEPIDDESDGTAYHIPEGILFVYDPKKAPANPGKRIRVSSKAVAPSLLENYGIPVPSYMTSERIAAIVS